MNELRLAIRLLLKSPVFSVVAVLSLAVGIGANTAIFSLVNDFLLRTLPVKNPDELVLFRNINGNVGRMSRAGENNGSIDPITGREASTSFSLLMFERMRAQRSAVSDLFAFAPFSQVNVLVDGQPEISATAQLVSGNYHTALGVQTAYGRTFTTTDDQTTAPPVAVISYRYWERRFARRTDIVGKTIDVNRVATTIVGVTAKGFDGAMQAGESPDVSVPLAHYLLFQPDRKGRAQPSYWWIRVMGRLAPDATPAQAAASLEPVFQNAARDGWLAVRDGASLDGRTPDVPTLAADPGARGENDVRRQFAGTLRVLMGLVSLVLAAACANIANLLLARGAERRREIALRLALGASRGRIVRQLFTEAMLLACIGAALGVLLAWWGRDLLLALRPFGNVSVVLDMPLDGRVLGFTAAVTIGTALLFGLSPALRATRLNLNSEFHSGGRTLGSGARSFASRAVMVVQIALSLVLLISTGLFVRTLGNLQRVDPGFNRHDLVLFRIDAASAGYARDQFVPLQSRLQERLERLPGIRAVTFSSTALLSRVRQNKRIAVSGAPSSGQPPIINTNGVGLNFFRAMELPLVLGRGFASRDDLASPKVAIVNQAFARTYLHQENPIGKHLVIPGYGDSVEVIGVAGDAKYTELRTAAPPTVYFPSLQQVDGNATFAIRFSPDHNAGAQFAAIRAAVREIDPVLPVLNLRTQDEQIERLNGQQLLFARLSGVFGGVALLLACIGLYGLTSHAVLRRTGEIGLRLALGALPAHVLRMILRESLMLATVGIAIGVAAAVGAGRFIASMLFELSPVDPVTYVVAGGVLVAVALLASAAPAWRASRVNAVTALKTD